MYKTITIIAFSFSVLTSSVFGSSSGSGERLELLQRTIPVINLSNKGEATTYLCQKALIGTCFRLQGEPSQITYKVTERIAQITKTSGSVNDQDLDEQISWRTFLNNTVNNSMDTILEKILSLNNTPNANYDVVKKDKQIVIHHREGENNYMFFLEFSKHEKN